MERYAFSGSGLASVMLPDSLKTLSAYTFNGCKALKEIRLPAQITRIPDGFLMNTALTTLTIPEGVNTIYSSAFVNNEQLTSVTLPASVRTVYSGAFNNTAVTDVAYAGKKADVQRISISESNAPLTAATWHCADGDTAYTPAVSGYLTAELQWKLEGTTLKITGKGAMPDGLIPWHAYRTTITRVEAGEGVTGVSSSAFSGMTALESVSLPSTLKLVGRYAFNGCKALQTVSIPEGTTTIEAYAFQNCEALSQISLPASLTTLSYGVFSNCASLGQIALPVGLNEIPDSLFQGSGLTSVRIPGSVSAIGVSAFANCRELTSVAPPYAMNTIANGAFRSAGKLTDVSFAGTAADAEKLNIGLNNTALINAAWTYTDSVGSYPSAKEGVLSPDFDWRLDFNGTLIVSGRSAMPDCNSSFHAPWHALAAGIERVEVSSGVDNIGNYAFSQLRALKEAALPDSVKRIGTDAFANTRSLTTLTLPAGLTTLEGNAFSSSGLTEIVLPDSLTSMGWGVFFDCEKLEKITLSAGLTALPESAFWYCRALTALEIPDGVTTISPDALYGCSRLTEISLPDTVLTVGSGAFSGCSSLTDVTYRGKKTNASTMSIASGNAALTGAAWYFLDGDGSYPAATSGALTASLQWRVEGDTLTIPGRGTMPSFSGTSAPWQVHAGSIQKIVLEDGLKTISDNAFSGFNQLQEVAIPNTVTSIGRNAFSSASALKAVTIPDSVTSIGDYAFAYSGLVSADIPRSVTVLGNAVFEMCNALADVQLNASVNTIPGSMFWNCTSLKSFKIPEGIEMIGDNAFGACYYLESVVLPASLQTVKNYAFDGCSRLADVCYCYYESEEDAFYLQIDAGNAPLTDAAWRYKQANPIVKMQSVLQLTAAVEVIPREAFEGTGIKAAEIPEGTGEIQSRAFANCPHLQYVSIPESVRTIAADAFEGSRPAIVCEEGGTIEAWAKEQGFECINP